MSGSTQPRPSRSPAQFRLYYLLLLVLGAAAVASVTVGGLAPAPGLALLLGAGALLVIAEFTPVPMPSGGYVSAATVIELPLLLLAGPFWATVVVLAVTVAVHGAIRRRPFVRVVHNIALFTVMLVAAGAVFSAMGGSFGLTRFPRDAGPMVAAGLVFFAVNSLGVSLAIGLTAGPSPWRVWQREFQQGILHHLSFVALGGLVAVTLSETGPWGLALCALPLLVSRYSFKLDLELRSDLKSFVRTLTEVLEEVDPYTRHHSHRVAEYSVRLARGLRRAEAEVDEIEYAALVHDLGKIGPAHQHILQKPGSLSHEEQRTLRAHPEAGAEIVAKVRALRRVSQIVRAHHERPDGQGYPYGLRTEDVPLGARILNVADAFDAMTSDRPYRRALPMDAALRELERGAGTQFDAEVVRCMLRLAAQGRFPLIPSPSSEDLHLLRLRTRVSSA